MSTWTKQKLGSVCIQITDGKHGDCINDPNSGYYFISSKDIFDGKIHYENARQIALQDFLDTHKRTKLENGDILITNSGTIGRMALVKDHPYTGRTTFQKSVAIIKPNPILVNNIYLYYLLVSMYSRLITLGGGSAQHNLLLGDLRNLEISLPDLPNQKLISSIIYFYDQLIEINEKRIKILEEMAQRLYTEWFVKFKFPGHEKVKMVDSKTEYGLIPEGWEVVKLPAIVDYLEGPGIRNWQYRLSGIPFLNIRTIGNGEINLSECNFLDEDEVRTKYSHFLLKENDVIVSSSGTLGRIAVIRQSHLPLCLNTSVIRFRETKVNIWYIKKFLQSKIFQNKIKALASGSAQLNYGPSHLQTINIINPPNILLTAFGQYADHIENEINHLRDQNLILIKIRDLLIPQLVTGRRELKN